MFFKNPVEAAEIIKICSQISRDIKHRGPDDEGFVLFDISGNCEEFTGDDSLPGIALPHISKAVGKYIGALIHRRLSVIVPGPKGHQPMKSADDRYWIVYNGETFNFKEIDKKYQFTNKSGNDAETALNLICKKEQQGFTELDGFHAFAVYDVQNKFLEIYRDPTGVKPLYFSNNNGRFAFCSESKALRKLLNLSSVNPKAVFHSLVEGITLPGEELINGIQEAKHKLEFSYNDFNPLSLSHEWTAESPDLELKEQLERSVESRLMSDVPLGFAVSGGLDSAAIIGIARKIMGNQADLKLFSVISNGAESEEKWQKLVADHNKAEWHTVNLEETNPNALVEIIKQTELLPVAWNNLAQYELARLAANSGITVFLNGQGADEIFGGYPDYLQRAWSSMPWFLFKNRKHLSLSYTEMVSGWLKNGVKTIFGKSIYKKAINNNSKWLSKDFLNFYPYLWSLSGLSADEKMQHDYFQQKLRQMLKWEDANGMAHGLESRNPFADDLKLANWLGYPFREKLKNGYTKGVLRDAIRDYVPEQILWRTDKKGFTVPDNKLTWNAKKEWRDVFLSDHLNIYSPKSKREKAFKTLNETDTSGLRWYFRLTAFSLYLDTIKNG